MSPDLDSIRELVRDADIEGLIADGAPQDEYDPEADAWFDQIAPLAPAELVADSLLPGLEALWRSGFDLNEDTLAQRRPELLVLARQIERFFGPAPERLVRNG